MYSVDQFCIPQHYKDDLEAIIVPHGMVLDRFAEFVCLHAFHYELRHFLTSQLVSMRRPKQRVQARTDGGGRVWLGAVDLPLRSQGGLGAFL